MSYVITRTDAYAQVKGIIEAGAASVEEFDIEGVMDEIGSLMTTVELHDEDGTVQRRWDVAAIDGPTFWDIMARHAKEL